MSLGPLVEWLIRDEVSRMSRKKFKGWASLPVFLGVSVFRNTEPGG